MDYTSNLIAPDLRPHFKHLHWRAMDHSFGHLVASDWADHPEDGPFALYKNCGLWTRDEAALLYNVAKRRGGYWCDIGAHTGWTTAHIAAGAQVCAVDPMLRLNGFLRRFEENTTHCWDEVRDMSFRTSADFFSRSDTKFNGLCIDGDHEPGKPLEDARNAVEHLGDAGVIIFHDFIGQPVREAVTWLMDNGFSSRVYFTPHMVAVCWRGDFNPPIHMPDPRLVDQLRPHLRHMTDFDFRRCV